MSTLKNVTVEVRYPDEQGEGNKAYRLMKYAEDYYLPLWELHEAEVEVYDDGDCDIGPRLAYRLGSWKQVAGGMGWPKDLDEALAQAGHNESQEG